MLAATVQGVLLRHVGVVAAAVARQHASAFGEEEYLDPGVKAAALLHSLTRNHPFVDGNKRAGWNCGWTFIEVNAIGRLAGDFDVGAAEQFVPAVASGAMDDLTLISAGLQAFSD